MPGTAADASGSVAGPKIWYTTELLEQILSCLPATAAVVVSGVDKAAYNCMISSPLIRQKMFLQLSGRELETWWHHETYTRSGNINSQTFELSTGHIDDS